MEKKEQNKLTAEQKLLIKWLEDNFISGKYWSIEEIVDNVKYLDGTPMFVLNKDPYKHDKCIKLSSMVRTINQCLVDDWKLIIKDTKGGIKLAENYDEFKTWWKAEKDKIDRKAIKLNMALSKAKQNGIVPLYDQDLKPLNVPTPIEPFAPTQEEKEDLWEDK